MQNNHPCCFPMPAEAGWDWIPTQPPKGQPCQQNGFDTQDWIADWQLNQRGAFAGQNALHSAVIMQLFSDRRLPNDQDATLTDPFERGGWWGDYFAPFPLGSYLWTLYRGFLNENTVNLARRYVREALQPLLDQGAAVRQDNIVQIDKLRQYLIIIPRLYAQDGAVLYQQQFQRMWGN